MQMLLEKAKQCDVVLTYKNGLIYLHSFEILKKTVSPQMRSSMLSEGDLTESEIV